MTNATQPVAASDIVQEARTVVLVVHGVGDHTQTNVLDALAVGVEAALPSGSWAADRLWIDGIPLPSGDLGRVAVTRIRTARGDRLIIPVIWSREHLRAAARIEHQLLMGRSSVQRVQALIGKTASPLLELCANLFRCIPKAATLWWRLALTAAALLISAVVACLTLGLAYGIVFLPYILQPYTSGFTSWRYVIAVAILPTLILFIFRRSVPVLDLIGDVVFYVGQPARRGTVEARMLRIVEWVRDSASHADIIVVGHSLGSVLVSHSLKDAPAMPAPRRLLLVTLGSPLPMMSRVFAGHVSTPRQLLAAYSASGSVSRWVHLWRDSDWIGRSLDATPADNFEQASVGDGRHANYWADSRISASLVALVEAQESGTIADRTRELAARELTNSERQQALQLHHAFQLMSLITLSALVALAYIGGDVFGAAFATTTSVGWVRAVQALYVANVLALVLLVFISSATRLRGTPRQMLGRLRFARSFFDGIFRMWILVGVSFFALRWLAPRL